MLEVTLPAGLALLVYGGVGTALGVAEISDIAVALRRRMRLN